MSDATPQDVLEGRARWCVVEGDCREVLRGMAPADVVLTDPPYDARTHRWALTISVGEIARGAKRGVSDFAALADEAATAAALISATRRWVVAFCALEQLGLYAAGAGEAWVRAGVWDRIAPAPQLSGDRPAQAVDGVAIMHAPGRRRWNRGGGAAIWRHLPERGDERPDHPTPKPLALMLDLVADFSEPGELVLDPFCGSGTTGVAALRLGRRFVGVEIDATYAALARERLASEVRGLSLSDARAGQGSLFGEQP